MRSTEYRARPGDGCKRLPMRLDNLALRMYDRVKRTLGLDDRFASRMLARIERLFRSGNRVP